MDPKEAPSFVAPERQQHPKIKQHPNIKQFAGEGKHRSLGVPVQPPEAVAPRGKKTSEGHHPLAEEGGHVPEPLPAYTLAEVDAMFGSSEDAYYRVPARGREFWDGADIWSLKVGMHVLWAGVSTGKMGGPSTKREVFSGYVHSWGDNDFVFLS